MFQQQFLTSARPSFPCLLAFGLVRSLSYLSANGVSLSFVFSFFSHIHNQPPSQPTANSPHNNKQTPYIIHCTMDFFAQAYTDKRASSPKPQPPRTSQGGIGYGCESNSHMRRASSGLEAEYGHNPRASSYSSCYSSSSPAWMNEGPKYVTHDARGDVDHPNDKDSTPTNYTLAARNATDRTSSSDVHNGSVRSPLYRRTSLTNPCLLHHTNAGGTVRPPQMPKSASSSSLLDSPRQEADHHSHPRFFSHTEPSTITEGQETKF